MKKTKMTLFIFLVLQELLQPGANVIKRFTDVSYELHNKLECLSLASVSRLAYCLWARPGAYPRVDHLSRLLPYLQTLNYTEKACKG
jgi:hypothetical protein